MIRNFYDIMNLVGRSGISFDTETLGFGQNQPMYSASYARWGAKEPTNHYFDVRNNLQHASYFGRKGWGDLLKEHKGLPSFKSYGKFGDAFASALEKTQFLVGHNLTFDFGVLRESLPNEQFEKIQKRIQGISNSELLAMRKSIGAKDPNVKNLFKYHFNKVDYHAGAVGKHIKEGDFTGAYRKLFNYIEGQQSKGLTSVVDTFQATRIFAGLAEEAGLVSWKNSKAMGAKLEYLAHAIGIKDAGKKSHTAFDTIFQQPVTESLLSKDMDTLYGLARKKRGSRDARISTIEDINRKGRVGLSDSSLRILKLLQSIEDPEKKIALDEYNLNTTIQNAAFEHHFRNKITKGTSVGRRATYYKSREEAEVAFAKRYNVNPAEIKKRFTEHLNNTKLYKSEAEAANYIGAKQLNEAEAIKNRVFGLFKEGSHPMHSTRFSGAANLGEAVTGPGARKFLMYGAGAVGAATLYSLMTGGVKNNYSPIEGLHPGAGPRSEGKRSIQEGTDFGSPLNMEGGLSKAFEIVKTIGSNFLRTIKENKGLTIAAAAPGLVIGYNEGKKQHHYHYSTVATSVGLGLIDDVVVSALPMVSKKIKVLEKLEPILQHPLVEKTGTALFGYSIGKAVGQMAGKFLSTVRIPSKDDAYNTIEGLFHGGVAEQQRKQHTDFGSGYQGMINGTYSPSNHANRKGYHGPNPDLEPEYNMAKDVYLYQNFRASSIGLSEEEIYKKMTEKQPEMSEYVSASASAGTALHQYMQALQIKQNKLYDYEKLVENREHGITGHIDEITAMGVGDIKTVSPGIFQSIMKSGKYKPQHYAQVQFYLGSTGMRHGYLQYVNRANPNQQKTFQFDFNPYFYQAELAKVERVRARVMEDITRGRLKQSSLPMTASFKTLEEDQLNKETPLEMAQTLDEKRQIFREEMNYLNSIPRPMPTGGPGYERIQKRMRDKRESAMVSTQGLGLQIYNNRNNHHVM